MIQRNKYGKSIPNFPNMLKIKQAYVISLLLIALLNCLFISVAVSQTTDFELSAKGMELVENWLGQSYKLDQAEQMFNEALKINPDNYEAITGLGRIVLRRGYISGDEYEMEALISAMSYANKAVAINNKYGKAYYLRWAVLAFMGKYTEALKDAQTLESLGRDNCKDYTALRGGTYKRLGKKKEAIDAFLDKLQCQDIKDIDRKQVYNFIGDIYMDMNDFNNAVVWLKKSTEILPTAWDYGNYGRALIALDKLDEAEVIVKKAISIQDYPMAHVYLSCIYAKRGCKLKQQQQYSNAELEFIKAIEEDQGKTDAYQGLADIYSLTGQCTKLENLLVTYPNDSVIKDSLAKCHPKN